MVAEAGFLASAPVRKGKLVTVDFSAFSSQFLVGLSRAMILFVVCAGLSFVLGVLRVPNIAHGSLYMIGAFATFTVTKLIGGSAGFWIALIVAPLLVALVSLVAERALFCHLYQREHLMLLLFTFALSLILGDLVKIVWGAEYRSVSPPALLKGSISIFGASLPRYNLFLLIIGPLVAVALWLFTNKTKIGKISRAAAVDREMVGVLGINVSWVFAIAFVIGCYLAGVGGALVAPTASIVIRNGSFPHHRSFPYCNDRGIGQHVGCSGGISHLWRDPIPGCADLASIRYRFPLSGSRHCLTATASRIAESGLVNPV